MIEHLKFKDVEMTIGEDSDVDLVMTFNTINRWLVSKKRLTIGKLSDGTHTFDELYRRITYLTAAVVNSNRLISWKSKRDDKGTKVLGGGWFIVGIDTPAGQCSYTFQNEYWDIFDVPTLPKAKKWDGFTGLEVDRFLSIFEEKES